MSGYQTKFKKEREILIRVQSNSHYNIRKVQFIKTALKKITLIEVMLELIKMSLASNNKLCTCFQTHC